MISNDLIPLINLLKEEIKKHYSLRKRYSYEKIFQKRDIIKIEINESMNKINLINVHIKSNIEFCKKLAKIQSEISKETKINNNSEKKIKKINDFIEKGKNILINNIPYYEKLPDYANKKLKTAKLSPLDLINLTLRLSQQSKAPPGGIEYLNSFISSALTSSRQNDVNIYSFYKKNKNRFLTPYPGELEMKQSILRYDFSEEKRLLPPELIYPDPININQEGYIIANNGSSIQLKYPPGNKIDGYFFKYSKDINILPSLFSGEEYKDYSQPVLDSNCIFRVCTCKIGFKDSKIVTFKFFINTEVKENIQMKKVGEKAGVDAIIKTFERIDTPVYAFNPVSPGQINSPSPTNTNGPGTSKYKPIFFNPEEHGGNKDDDEEDEDGDLI